MILKAVSNIVESAVKYLSLLLPVCSFNPVGSHLDSTRLQQRRYDVLANLPSTCHLKSEQRLTEKPNVTFHVTNSAWVFFLENYKNKSSWIWVGVDVKIRLR